MKVDFIRSSYIRFYKKHKTEINKAISDRLNKGSLIMEDSVKEFERKFANFCGKKYCLAVSSGTDALNMSKAIRNPYYMQSYRYRLLLPGVQEVPIKKGVIDLDNFKPTKNSCLLVTYMNSAQPDLKELKRIKKKYNLFIIEDACQAVGRRLVGDISCFSFYPAKILGGMGKGGALVTDSNEIYEKLKLIRDDKWNNLWLDEVKAAYLIVKLKYLPEFIKVRQNIADRYNKKLKCKILSKDCLQNYIILEDKKAEMIKYLKDKGIEAIDDNNDFYIGNLKNGIRLPIYPEMTEEEVNYVIKCVNDFYDKE